MEQYIRQISKGGSFLDFFNNIIVEKCYYINASDEKVEQTSILSEANGRIFRRWDNGPIVIRVYDNHYGLEYELARFRANYLSYREDEHAEIAQTALIRGDEIIEEHPLTHSGFEDGKINFFMISKQRGKTIAFLIINPKDIDDYYYRIIFES